MRAKSIRSGGAAIGVVALMLLPTATPLAHEYASGDGLNEVSIGALKRAYLACNDAAIGGRMGSGSVMQCSIVYEALKRRAFGGDFGKLLAWSQAQPPAVATGRRGGEAAAVP